MTATLPEAASRPTDTAPSRSAPSRRRSRGPMVPGNLPLTMAAAVASALGALALAPLFTDGGWYLPALAGIAVVALTGAGARAARVPLVVHPLLQGAALAVLLTVLYAGSTATWGFLPNGEALDVLRRTIQTGLTDIDRFAPPVPTSTGIVAVTVLGVGLAALLIDVLAVPLRTPALAGIPLLGMYLVPVAVQRNGAPWWAFVPGAVGWLVLLTIDSRETLAGWGAVLDRVRRPAQPVDADDPSYGGTGSAAGSAHATVASARAPGVGAAARRLGLLAVGLAVLLPLLLPSLAEPVFRRGGGEGGDAEAGVSGTVTLNPFVSLKRDYFEGPDRVVLAYSTDDPTPEYLRTVTLNRFTGDTWEPDAFEVRNDREVNGGLPPQVDFLSDQGTMPVRSYQVRIRGLDGRYLPAPYPAVTVSIGSGWFYDPATRVIFSENGSINGARYSVSVVDVVTTPDRLRQAPPIVAPAVGGSLDTNNTPPSINTLARAVVGDAPTAYDQAVALQDWFRSEFRYSTAVRSGNSASYLQDFLRERVGYCEQFAASMALMARTLGIPARVAVGFTAGSPVGDGRWQVSMRDAHAWPELWFAGTGWVRFEPTPQGDGGDVTVPTYAEPDSGGTTPTPNATGAGAPGGSGLQAERIRDRELERDVATDEILDVGSAGETVNPVEPEPWRGPLVGGLLVLGLVVAAVPLAIRAWRRRRRLAARGAALTEGAWAELRDTCLDVGRQWSDAATPRQQAAAIAAQANLPDDAVGALGRLVDATESTRYARPGSQPRSGDPRGDLRTVRGALLAGVSAGRRWQARLWPASARPWRDPAVPATP